MPNTSETANIYVNKYLRYVVLAAVHFL